MVGDLPAHLLKSSLEPLHEAMVVGPWQNRNLLLLPLASSATLAHEGLSLGRGTGVQVRTTPQVTRPADAWAFVSGTWNKLREQWRPATPPPPAPAPAPVDPTPMTPMPAVRPAASAAAPVVESTLGRYVRRLAGLPRLG